VSRVGIRQTTTYRNREVLADLGDIQQTRNDFSRLGNRIAVNGHDHITHQNPGTNLSQRAMPGGRQHVLANLVSGVLFRFGSQRCPSFRARRLGSNELYRRIVAIH
jgi:hypothetical protein